MNKNDEIEILITGMTSDGNGVGRYENLAVFVPFSAIGDRLRVLIVKVKSNYCYGKIIEIIEPSNDRTDDDCASFLRCGGCAYRHIDYSAELEIKKNHVCDCFKKIGKTDVTVEEILSDKSDKYRNKAQYPFAVIGEKITAGFFAKRSHRVVPCEDCLLQPDEFSLIVKTVCKTANELKLSVYDETAHKGLLRHIFLRRAEKTGEYMVVIVINGDTLPNADKFTAALKSLLGESLASFEININKEKTNVVLGKWCKTLYGKPYITDILCGKKIRISPLSFYQVNRAMAEKLYERAAEYAEPQGKNILDLYCGTGTIGLSMADGAKSVVGVEIVPEAIEDAKINAAENGVNNISFICDDAAGAAQKIADSGKKIDVVIIDPPRKGMAPELIDTVANKFSPERVVYVSCDPATLARDCKIFKDYGYELKKLTVADLFPKTCHVETVCLLTREITTHDMKLHPEPFETIKSETNEYNGLQITTRKNQTDNMECQV